MSFGCGAGRALKFNNYYDKVLWLVWHNYMYYCVIDHTEDLLQQQKVKSVKCITELAVVWSVCIICTCRCTKALVATVTRAMLLYAFASDVARSCKTTAFPH